MGAVLAGLIGSMTLLQWAELLSTLASLAIDAPKLMALLQKVKEQGHPENAPLPAEHKDELRAALLELKPAAVVPIAQPDPGDPQAQADKLLGG